jgi:hypothetical protein
MMFPTTIGPPVVDACRWVYRQFRYRHLVKAAYTSYGFIDDPDIKDWIISRPDTCLFWAKYDFPYSIVTYHFAFRRKEDAVMFALKKP